MFNVDEKALENLRGIVAKEMIQRKIREVDVTYKGVDYNVRLSELANIYDPRLLQSAATTLRGGGSSSAPVKTKPLRGPRKRAPLVKVSSDTISYGEGWHPTLKWSIGEYDPSAIIEELKKYIRREDVIVRRSKLDWAKVVMRLHTDVPRLFVLTKRTRKVIEKQPIVIVDDTDSFYGDDGHFLQTCCKACSILKIPYYVGYKAAKSFINGNTGEKVESYLDLFRDNPSQTFVIFGDMCSFFGLVSYDSFISMLESYDITLKFYVRFMMGDTCGCDTIPKLTATKQIPTLDPRIELFYDWNKDRCLTLASD